MYARYHPVLHTLKYSHSLTRPELGLLILAVCLHYAPLASTLSIKPVCVSVLYTTRLQTLYGNVKVRMFESQWSELLQTTNINTVNIELTPKAAKSGNTYYKAHIQSVSISNAKNM
jgi:hypothetical protein